MPDPDDYCPYCGWQCDDPDELAIHIEDCEAQAEEED